MLTAFSQVYSENPEQKSEQKDLKICSMVRKASVKLGQKKA
jgi:hypothetical protein